VHEKWRKFWRENNTNAYDPKGKGKPYYCLEMFSYPSGASLHMGHYFNFAPSDTHARFKRMCGFNVFQPMGFDAFGLPAENHALKTDTTPWENTEKNMKIMRRQLEELGGMYDWDYTLATCTPEYYKWTQWLFVKLFKAGLAYQADAPVNWCDKCKTVLANEQVVGGACERCDTVVERRNMKQWFFKITDYAEKLLDGIDKLDWPNKTKVMQRNWIGKSEGASIEFPFVGEGTPQTLQVFTTRPDTLPCVTFIAVASDAQSKREDDKNGRFTGKYVINPFNGEKIPVWEADYILANYGTGAIMGVPKHDERDAEFAAKYKIPVKDEPLLKPAQWKKFGKTTTNYRLHDWSVGRQRYWGAPIPIIYCPEHGAVPVPETDLPVLLPKLKDFKPRGAAPLANDPKFVNTKCPICGKPSKRECDTMDTFVCSSWYYLRYPFAKRNDVPFEKTAPVVNKYIGGAEHACMHLLYARFITKFLHDQKLITFDEPFPSLVHQGMILAKDGTKMSKSKGNTVAPDDYVNKYGSDILRLFLMFGFKYTEGGPWNEDTLKTITKFTERVEKVASGSFVDKATPDLLYVQANSIKSVREDLENFSFNTAVARCMELLNAIEKTPTKESVETLVLLLAPMLPHLCEEFWEMLGHTPSIFNQPYPKENEKHLTRAEVEIAVQINSKIVGRITIPSDAHEHAVTKLCAEFLAGKTVTKTVYIKNRLINFIV